jgi:ribosomal protein S18 acetylase RimI-like enzyme
MTDVPRYVIRAATVEDVEFLADVVLAATRAQGRLTPEMDQPQWRMTFCEWTRAQVEGELSDNETSVIEVDGERIGRLRVVRTPIEIELAGIQLVPHAQRRGIGTTIIESLKSEATAASVLLELGVEKDNPDAHRLYAHLGFVEIG